MKKLLSLSPSKIFIFCGLGVALTLGAFWHHQTHQTQLDRLNVLNQGVGTCFNRISQSFTAIMIRDIKSPYLHQGFMALSDECLNETIKGINPFRRNVGKGFETLNQLISETHWFHEKIMKIHAPMLAGRNANASLSPLADRFSKIENFKVNLVDEIESSNAQIREIQLNDQVLMGIGLLIFVVSLSLLSLQEFNRIQLQKETERQALNYLRAGQGNVGAIVDQLVDRALRTQNMPVTAQIFHDYHGGLLERLASRGSDESKPFEVEETLALVTAGSATVEEDANETDLVRTSLKEVLVNLQNIHTSDLIKLSDLRDVQVKTGFESLEQMMNAAINKFAGRRENQKKIMITNQIHSDRAVISLFLAESTFTSSELEFATQADALTADGIDMNMIVLKEMVRETGAQWFMENKTDRRGKVTGMTMRFVLPRAKQQRKNLVSVIRGKKRDLARELMN